MAERVALHPCPSNRFTFSNPPECTILRAKLLRLLSWEGARPLPHPPPLRRLRLPRSFIQYFHLFFPFPILIPELLLQSGTVRSNVIGVYRWIFHYALHVCLFSVSSCWLFSRYWGKQLYLFIPRIALGGLVTKVTTIYYVMLPTYILFC